MIKLTATPESRQDVKELAAFFEGLNRPTPDMRKSVGDIVRYLFEQRFGNEGGPGSPWAELRKRTIDERGNDHPILQRTGEYNFSFTDLGGLDNVEQLVTRGSGWTLELGSSDSRVEELEGGRTSPTFMAERPVTLLGDGEESEIGDELDIMFGEMADKMDKGI